MMNRIGMCLVLAMLFAGTAKADEITTPDGLLIIPSGSTVTSESVLKLFPDVYTVDFQFPGGSGFSSGDFIDGDHSTITFTMPVTNLSFTATFTSEGDLDVLNGSTGFFFECSESGGLTHCPSQLNETFAGPVTSIIIGSDIGSSGIESMSFTEQSGQIIDLAVKTPEPSALLLLLVGMVVAVAVASKTSNA